MTTSSGPLLTALSRHLPQDPPLDPSGDEARSALRRELAKPDYYDTNVIERIMNWISRRFDGAVNDVSGMPPLMNFLLVLVVVGIIVLVGWLVSRVRLTAKDRSSAGPALVDEGLSAADLRARADAALADGRFAEAVVDGFRALALRQIEAGRIEDLPQATAHELAGGLADVFAGHRPQLGASADLFDAVLYGDRVPDRGAAASVLSLDSELADRRALR